MTALLLASHFRHFSPCVENALPLAHLPHAWPHLFPWVSVSCLFYSIPFCSILFLYRDPTKSPCELAGYSEHVIFSLATRSGSHASKLSDCLSGFFFCISARRVPPTGRMPLNRQTGCFDFSAPPRGACLRHVMLLALLCDSSCVTFARRRCLRIGRDRLIA